MIVCTKAVDTVCRKAFGAGNVAVSAIDNVMGSFALDPTVTSPVKEMFIVADADVRNPKIKKKFLEAAASKHPDVHIVFYVKSAKTDVKQGNGIDLVVNKLNPKALSDTIYSLIEEISAKPEVESSAEKVAQSFDKFTPPEFEAETLNTPTETEEPEVQEMQVEDLKVDEAPAAPEEIDDVEDNGRSELVERIKSCGKISDVAVLTRELTASAIVKDIMKDNAQYTHVEERLKAIQEKIYNIFVDPTIPSMEVKLDKIQALLIDKAYYRAKNGTVLEQRIEDIINVITSKARELISERVAQLDDAIERNVLRPRDNIDYTRIAGITDERANLMLELEVLNKEVQNIFTRVDEVGTEVASYLAEDGANLTGNPLVDARMSLYGESVITEQAMDSITHILYTCDQSTEEFKDAVRKISIIQKKLNKLIDLDKESIAALSQIIAYLKANNVEDTVIANTMIKKSLRLFVAKEGSGRTVVPYTLSKLKSRENANVLYVDLTGTSKLDNYGEPYVSVEHWVVERPEREFLAVAGSISNSAETAQRIMNTLVKCADYYKVINVVLDPSQTELISLLAPDVLVINYLMDANPEEIDFFKSFVNDTKYDNVARRVIVNRCDVSLRPIVDRLGLFDDLGVHITKVPYIPQLVDCSMLKVRPYELEVVKEALREVRKAC